MKANDAVEAVEANIANEFVAADKTEADEVDEANKASETGKAIPFSLTKCSIFIVKVKGHFEISNNQLRGPFGGNQINSCSLKKQCINQLENSG